MKAVIHKNKNALGTAGFSEDSTLNPAISLNARWQEISRRYLPAAIENSIWRFSRRREPGDAEQGWKLHVSATILSASTVLGRIGAFLESERAFYKAPVSLYELEKINSGFYYEYSQIGKFITVYPQTEEQAVYFAERLHRLTCRIPAPSVPFDLKFKSDSLVHYRYGAFQGTEIRNGNSAVPDVRDAKKPFPDWISNPFPVEEKKPTSVSPLKNYRIFRALSQRGKGGVYLGIDLTGGDSAPVPRLCLIKEGRRSGEVFWDGRDGSWRVQHEEFVLKTLRAAGVGVPQVYASFVSESSYFLVTEFIAGENLDTFLRNKKRRLSLARAARFALELAETMARIHAAGWFWRDCKPKNIIVTPAVVAARELRVLDFEGACRTAEPAPALWSSLLAETPELYERFFVSSPAATDLYALGSIIYLLFEGELPPPARENFLPKFSRRGVPSEIKLLIRELLNPLAARNCKAQAVASKLKAVLQMIEK